MCCEVVYNSVEKSWSGCPYNVLWSQNISIGHALITCLNRGGQKICQIYYDTGQQDTYRTMLYKTLVVASNFRELGINTGDTVTFIAEATVSYPALLFGAFAVGAIINPLDPRSEPSRIETVLTLTTPKVIICDEQNCEIVKTIMDTLKLNTLLFVIDKMGSSDDNFKSTDFFLEKHQADIDYVPPDIGDGSEKTAVIIETVGTIDKPKLLKLSHAAILENLSKYIFIESITVIAFGTVLHYSGLMNFLGSVFGAHTRVLTKQKFSVDLMIHMITRFSVKILITSPIEFRELITTAGADKLESLSSIRLISSEDDNMPIEVINKLKRQFPNQILTAAYSLTEFAGGCAYCMNLFRDDQLHRISRGVSIKIIDETGLAVNPKIKGEICVKGVFKFLGYLGELSTKHPVDSNEWLHTGDIGYIDEMGFLHIVDRKQNAIHFQAGESKYVYYCRELESILKSHQKVKFVAVVAMPNKIFNEVPTALIVVKPNKILTEEDIHEYLRNKVPDHQHLRGGVYFVPELPMNSKGKFQRYKLKELLLQSGYRDPL